MRRLLLVLLVTLGLAGIMLGPAAASTQPVKTKVTIKLREAKGKGTFSGKVKAKGACKKGRKVTVREDPEYGGPIVGKDRSNKHGKYKIKVKFDPKGPYAAQAKKKKIKKGKDTIVCKKGLSKLVNAK